MTVRDIAESYKGMYLNESTEGTLPKGVKIISGNGTEATIIGYRIVKRKNQENRSTSNLSKTVDAIIEFIDKNFDRLDFDRLIDRLEKKASPPIDYENLDDINARANASPRERLIARLKKLKLASASAIVTYLSALLQVLWGTFVAAPYYTLKLIKIITSGMSVESVQYKIKLENEATMFVGQDYIVDDFDENHSGNLFWKVVGNITESYRDPY